MMILKLAMATVLALFTATPLQPVSAPLQQPPGARASFVYGINGSGGESFDLQVSASQWENFSHGERLDVAHQNMGRQTWIAVTNYVDRGVRKAGICRAGWMLGEYSLDTDGTRHFKGLCVRMPTRT
jgi:hypothetical protein